MIKKLFQHIALFMCVLACLVGMLVLTAKIPQDKIYENVLESAEFLCEDVVFPYAVEGVKSSRIDRYADSILLAIAYQYDSDNVLESVMWSSYYNDPFQNENTNLYTAVSKGIEANKQYLRYWHGSNAIVRTLLVFLDIEEIYIFHAAVIALLGLILLGILIRKKAYVPAGGIVAGLVATAVWFVPLSLEYTWTYLVMLALSIAGVTLAYRKKAGTMSMFFMAGGMIINYFDFLSAETLTLTVPLLLILWIRDREGKMTRKEAMKFMGTSVVSWGIGYVGMWISKWIMAAIVLGENVMPYVAEHVDERLGGDLGMNIVGYAFGALARNIQSLFPLDYGIGGLFAGLGIGFFAIFVGYVYYKKEADKSMIPVYLLVALIPYIRYMVLRNHSYLHYFFTYRAQMATVLAVVFVLDLLTDRRWLARGRRVRR